MVDLALAVAGAACAAGVAEAALRIRKPHRLWPRAFDESTATQPHPTRGWTPRPSAAFTFYNRFLPATRAVALNNLGLHDDRAYEPAKAAGLTRVALVGDTVAAGFEHAADRTMARHLERILAERAPGRAWQVLNAGVRNYGLVQLADFFEEHVAPLEPDVVVYLFVSNHPRRSITFHESGKPTALHQPLLRPDGSGGLARIAAPPPTHANDMIYLDDRFQVVREPARPDAGTWRRLRDRSHLLTILDDVMVGDTRLRALTDRKEIKTIEGKKPATLAEARSGPLPYQWALTRALLEAWSRSCLDRGMRFVVMPALNYYHAGGGRLYDRGTPHPLGQDFERIPDRTYLRVLCEGAGVEYVDSYAVARTDGIDTAPFYLHPRYAYPTDASNAFHAGLIAGRILDGTGEP